MRVGPLTIMAWTLAACGLLVALFIATRDEAVEGRQEIRGTPFFGPTVTVECGTALSPQFTGRTGAAECKEALSERRELAMVVAGVSLIVGLGGAAIARSQGRGREE